MLLPAAAALVLAFGAGLWLGNRDDASVAVDDPADAAAAVTLSGTALAPDATASGLIFDRGAGYSIRLHVDGLSPAPQGEYYEGWLQSVGGDLVSVGTFHMRGGDGSVVLWSGVGVDDYPTLLVTEADRGPGGVLAAGGALRAGRLRRPRTGRRPVRVASQQES